MKEPEVNTLPPELQTLVALGMMSRDEAQEANAFMDALTDAVVAGEITLKQASALGGMLGVQDAERALRRAS